jgi:hypothetical protein
VLGRSPELTFRRIFPSGRLRYYGTESEPRGHNTAGRYHTSRKYNHSAGRHESPNHSGQSVDARCVAE